jgi:uncharacterized cupredoxin-like copper-binding protein
VEEDAAVTPRPLVVAAVAAAGSLAAVGVTSAASTVSVTAGKPSEFHFRFASKAPAGKVTFRVTNRGTVTHDFKIAGRKTTAIAPGKTRSVTVTLKRGTSYKYLCTVPGHAGAGMKGRLTPK